MRGDERSVVVRLTAATSQVRAQARAWQHRRRAWFEFSELSYRDVKDLGFPVLGDEEASSARWKRNDWGVEVRHRPSRETGSVPMRAP